MRTVRNLKKNSKCSQKELRENEGLCRYTKKERGSRENELPNEEGGMIH